MKRTDRERGIALFVIDRLRWGLAAMVAVALAATVGYVVVEHYSWLDALYMTVITLGTVGYGEVKPLHGGGRLLTVGVIVAGFATVVYMASVLTDLFVSGDASRLLEERRARRVRERLEHHVIVVGFGRVGQAVLRGFLALGKQCVVMDTNPDHEAAITAAGAVHVEGDATNEEDLRRAGIERADALVSAADQDSENLVVVLTARSMRPDLRIVSRVNQSTWLRRIKQAGADVAESPYESYGSGLAAAALVENPPVS